MLVKTPKYKQIAENRWETVSVGIYYCKKLQTNIIVPTGFICNLASLPQFFVLCGMLDRYDADIASVFHDYLYVTHKTSRADADRIFYEIMNITKNPKGQWKRDLFYWAVKVFGSTGYKRRNF